MSVACTTTLSTKGQVVIPEEIRERLGLKAGTPFVVVAERDVVILKVLAPPAMSEFAPLMAKARRAAKRSGMRQKDIARAITKVRGER
jgi:AbrB family looped-hinge helix DNA binding protein